MRDNPVQFAVVREDPLIECDLVALNGCRRVLLIGSGGCTALTLQARYPELDITVIDPNPAQLDLIGKKTAALRRAKGKERDALFNIENADPMGLSACGNFESLFRELQGFIEEFICEKKELETMFDGPGQLAAVGARLMSHRYWPVGFRLFFSDAMLLAMFGPAAIQHAAPGSYPGYFQRVFENGLKGPGALTNYFLHHLLLGRYRGAPETLPYYLVNPGTNYPFRLIETSATDHDDYERYDLVSLSNIMDWMSEEAIAELAGKLAKKMAPSARLVFRQLNHGKTFDHHFESSFGFDAERAARMLATDRSLFYSRLNIATKL